MSGRSSCGPVEFVLLNPRGVVTLRLLLLPLLCGSCREMCFFATTTIASRCEGKTATKEAAALHCVPLRVNIASLRRPLIRYQHGGPSPTLATRPRTGQPRVVVSNGG